MAFVMDPVSPVVTMVPFTFGTVNVLVVADFSGSAAGLSHGYIAQTMFFRSFE